MEFDVKNWLTTDNSFNLYLTLFISLILGGFGFPIPEDVPVVLAGVAAAQGIASLKAVLFICYGGVILADQIIFLAGYFFGQRLLSIGIQSPFFPSLTEERIESIRAGLRKRRFLYILLGRHLFPLRTATFLTAGAVGIPFVEFFVADAIAALLSVSFAIWLGYFLGGSLTADVISAMLHESHRYIAVVTAIVVFVYGMNFFYKKRKLKKRLATTDCLSSGSPQFAEVPTESFEKTEAYSE